ncbi:hypothetical protein QYE76_050464 [Lolium multiflorum]|uniref:Uncharacterized protein n=1 Tax=Lolium multiflorum TaxID=4521 RepID=A0AAD8WJL7_LOLMU|nr:hypothetical protein QYE76_050464 [Lolium multiflorum]
MLQTEAESSVRSSIPFTAVQRESEQLLWRPAQKMLTAQREKERLPWRHGSTAPPPEGTKPICKYLVEELGGDVNASGCGARAQGATPLMKAAQAGHVPTVKYFIDCGGDLMKVDDKGRTVLHHAAGAGSCEVTELLLSKGMPVDLDFGRGTPLIIASINGEHKTLKILLDHQADPNITTTGVGLPMLHALIYRSFECMKLLIEAGADVNCKGSMMNPLVFATMQGGYTNYIKLLLKTGADPNIPDDVRGGQEDAGKIKAIADMTSQRKERDLTNASMRMRWDQPFIDYTHTFGDELFDLCFIPNEGITMSEKQADALVMLQASRFVHLLSIEFSLKIPVRIRMGGGTVRDGERIVQAPVAVPLSADSPYAVGGFTAKQIGEL